MRSLRTAALMIALILCLCSNIASAQLQGYGPAGGVPECSASFWANPAFISSTGVDVGIALLALNISFFVVAIAFIINRFFPHIGIRNWIQNEYWEIAKSALLIVSVYSLIIIAGNFAQLAVPSIVPQGVAVAHTGGSYILTPLVNGAENYLCQVNNNVENIWGLMGVFSGGTGFWSSFKVSYYVPIPIGIPFVTPVYFLDGGNFLPFANWALQTGNFYISPYGSILSDLINFVLFPITALELVLIHALPVLANLGLTFFIPLGLVFRAFPFIRGVGGTLVAIGITLCLVFPMMLVMFNYTVTNAMTSSFPLTPPQSVYQPFSLHTTVGNALSEVNTEACTNVADNFFGTNVFSNLLSEFSGSFCTFFFQLAETPIWAVVNVVDFFSYFANEVIFSDQVFSTTAIYYFMNMILAYGAYVVIQLVLFAIDLMLMYPIADSIARSLGGSIRLSLGGKMRLA